MTSDDPQEPSGFVYGKETYGEMEARQNAALPKKLRRAYKAQQRLNNIGYGRPSMSSVPLTPGNFIGDILLWWKLRIQATYLRWRARPFRRMSGK